jgi:hypothetical protein
MNFTTTGKSSMSVEDSIFMTDPRTFKKRTYQALSLTKMISDVERKPLV